jgi:polysaccharide export outer membrane protein
VTRARAALCVALCLALPLSACSNGPRLGETSESLAVTALHELPPPTGTVGNRGVELYRIAPLDKISIVVAGVTELSGTFRTDTRGHFVFPYLGDIDASHHTPAELSAAMEKKLAVYVRDPRVAVNIEDATSLSFTVDGQVGQPGTYPITANMTLMRAVAAARGNGEFARLDDVVIFRQVEGKAMAGLYDLGQIRRGVYPDPPIYAGDIIQVGDAKGRRQFQQFLQTVPLLATPIILLIENL